MTYDESISMRHGSTEFVDERLDCERPMLATMLLLPDDSAIPGRRVYDLLS